MRHASKPHAAERVTHSPLSTVDCTLVGPSVQQCLGACVVTHGYESCVGVQHLVGAVELPEERGEKCWCWTKTMQRPNGM